MKRNNPNNPNDPCLNCIYHVEGEDDNDPDACLYEPSADDLLSDEDGIYWCANQCPAPVTPPQCHSCRHYKSMPGGHYKCGCLTIKAKEVGIVKALLPYEQQDCLPWFYPTAICGTGQNCVHYKRR